LSVDVTERRQGPKPGDQPLWRRLAWFVALWALGVLTIAIVGYVIRAVMFS